jgi:alkylation response protein AidB-like acyl-CoA dehydrogenase
MGFVPTEEQEMLRETARDFAQSSFPIDALRSLRDEPPAAGYDEKRWKEMSELGWLGIPFPEEMGGAGLGYADLGVVVTELGRQLAVSPVLSTLVLGGGVVMASGDEALQRELVPAITEGRLTLAVAHQETPRHDPWHVATRAEPDGSGYRITGRKCFVLDGASADGLFVLARTSGERDDAEGLTLFRVDPGAEGVRRSRTLLIDSRSAANIDLDGVSVGADTVVGEVGKASAILGPVFDRAAVAVSAEMLGGIEASFERTVAFLKEREQFGVKIGSFQALKHRAARWFCEVELARSIVLDAVQAIDDGRPDAALVASACKARASDVFRDGANEGVQMHGGVGVTDEEDIGFYLKRSRVCELLFGDSGFHRNRFAELSGF